MKSGLWYVSGRLPMLFVITFLLPQFIVMGCAALPAFHAVACVAHRMPHLSRRPPRLPLVWESLSLPLASNFPIDTEATRIASCGNGAVLSRADALQHKLNDVLLALF